MQFTIQRIANTVVIASRPILLNGQPCKAKIDPARKRILISHDVPRDERRRVLLHELRHLWVNAHGATNDPEVDADQAAEMMDALMRQYEDQGGDAALELLDPIADKPHRTQSLTAITGPLGNTSSECGGCGQRVFVGSIANGKPEWSTDADAYLMDRGMCCPACDKVTAWREACSEAGMPLGAIVAFPPPRVLRGAEASQWMREHAELCNVTVLA